MLFCLNFFLTEKVIQVVPPETCLQISEFALVSKKKKRIKKDELFMNINRSTTIIMVFNGWGCGRQQFFSSVLFRNLLQFPSFFLHPTWSIWLKFTQGNMNSWMQTKFCFIEKWRKDGIDSKFFMSIFGPSFSERSRGNVQHPGKMVGHCRKQTFLGETHFRNWILQNGFFEKFSEYFWKVLCRDLCNFTHFCYFSTKFCSGK